MFIIDWQDKRLIGLLMKFQLHLLLLLLTWLIVIINIVIIISIVTIIIIIALLLLLSFLLFFVVLSILFYLLLIFLLFLSACRVVTYDVYVSPRPYFIIILAFLVSDLHYIMALLIQASYHCCLYPHRHHHFHLFLVNSTS